MDTVKIEEVNEGTKIDYEQIGTKLIFDDMLMINCEKYQKDFDITIDIVSTLFGDLTIGADKGTKYVAQVMIPAAQYDDVKNDDGDDSTQSQNMSRVKKPLNMSDVTLRLWSID